MRLCMLLPVIGQPFWVVVYQFQDGNLLSVWQSVN